MQCITGDIVVVDDDLTQGLEGLEGRVREYEEMKKRHLAPVSVEDIPKVKKMNKNRRKNWMRNKPCPCGSGIKFKKCCWLEYV